MATGVQQAKWDMVTAMTMLCVETIVFAIKMSWGSAL